MLLNTYGGVDKYETMTTESQDYTVTLGSNEDATFIIEVKSEDNIGVKRYVLIIQHPRSVQEAVKIVTRNKYVVDHGVTVTQATYHLEIGTIRGEKIRNTDKIMVYQSDDLILECTGPFPAARFRMIKW